MSRTEEDRLRGRGEVLSDEVDHELDLNEELYSGHLDPQREVNLTLPFELEEGGSLFQERRRDQTRRFLIKVAALALVGIAGFALLWFFKNLLSSSADTRGTEQGSQGTRYNLIANFSGPDFLDKWEFWTDDDPTLGTVNYVTKEEAVGKNLTFFDANTRQWYLKADTSARLGAGARGRDSIRMESLQRFHQVLLVLDVSHIPTGCGTWPAFWMYDAPWPTKGEIDIIEGVHLSNSNAVTLHTDRNCSMHDLPSESFQGVWNLDKAGNSAAECSVTARTQWPNQGCGQSLPRGTMGAAFNEEGGGVYVMDWSESGIKVYFFPRGTVPEDVEAGRPSPNESWGTPFASFKFGQHCSSELYAPQRIVINLTFCGSWAGEVW
eukprot:CAMPEP_0117664464 /NCGR_PEP_ID=MMETSP0804-20121206/9234_1 /TAXON_ID=1074897 /ORGANISM="Tetraselmis astigmatica, Strain CCMP880" /LENGTH=378 /DNA_ID=CAMNT_0005471699 /DNA_START=225 /DNA_END=1358 /DNA_ORIENTATION=+